MNSRSLTIVADAHIWGVVSAFASLPGFDVDLRVMENHEITNEALKDADILLTRSSTRVNADLLEGTPIRFAATATIGDDHYDKAWLEANGIQWANAAGSSTGSVLEYMITALLELHGRGHIFIPDTTLGIIGAGRIGGALATLCQTMGMATLLNDPPREREEGSDCFSPMDELLSDADVITLHTPLLREGMDKTFHLIDAALLSRFRGRGIINAARGGCVDNDALADWLDESGERFAVIDCWEGEPLVSRRLLGNPQVVLATPHIAGHSLDGKAANTQYAYHALCSYLGIEPEWSMALLLPADDDVEVAACSEDVWRCMHSLASALYPMMQDVEAMRGWLTCSDDALAKAFASYRRHYPVRRSWVHSRLSVAEGEVPALFEVLVHGMQSHLVGSR